MVTSKSTTPFSKSDPNTWAPLLTLKQASEILNASPWTLRQWDDQKRLVAIRFGSRRDRKYRKEDVLKALKEGL